VRDITATKKNCNPSVSRYASPAVLLQQRAARSLQVDNVTSKFQLPSEFNPRNHGVVPPKKRKSTLLPSVRATSRVHVDGSGSGDGSDNARMRQSVQARARAALLRSQSRSSDRSSRVSIWRRWRAPRANSVALLERVQHARHNAPRLEATTDVRKVLTV